ncbi:hypothetical protein PRIPAC_86314 [Pristionchus pacificus]|uniref:Uncharacterized protein n=1 Tax=Pristionchus pacificus TaxID=54126 RepID=A0A2A6BSU2_PRIPA|nr:hypothetical protein PRIPAC_86314 [Pristionchus pacificus]|eukprot:PDM68927.1 hypothetical protein PRIPAC_47229 [Pristionchus pacificus]
MLSQIKQTKQIKQAVQKKGRQKKTNKRLVESSREGWEEEEDGNEGRNHSQPGQMPEPGSSQTVVVALYLEVQPRSIPVEADGPACQPPLGHTTTRPSGRREAGPLRRPTTTRLH